MHDFSRVVLKCSQNHRLRSMARPIKPAITVPFADGYRGPSIQGDSTEGFTYRCRQSVAEATGDSLMCERSYVRMNRDSSIGQIEG